MRRGLLLAHHTATLPGVAALPDQPLAVARLQRFKRRPSPFLLLISPDLASRVRVRRWIAWRSRQARQWMRRRWPGETTLLLSASRRAPVAAVERGAIALRMVDDDATKRLLRRCGGALYSSSLNRAGDEPRFPTRRQRRRWRHFIALPGTPGSGIPSALISLRGRRPQTLR